ASHLYSRTGHIARIIRSQQYIYWSQFSRLSCPFQRHILPKTFYFLFRHGRRNEGGPDGSRCYTIYTDALFCPQLSQPCREVLNSSFGRRISQQSRRRLVSIDRCSIYHGTAGLHMRLSGFAQMKHCKNVGTESTVKLLSRYILY